MNWNLITKTALDGEGLTPDQAHAAITALDHFELFYMANQLRNKFFGNTVSLCGIVNAKSGNCSEDCRFCAQSGHHSTAVNTYPLLSLEVIIAQGQKMFSHGAKGFSIVTSGKNAPDAENLAQICQAVSQIAGDGYLCSSLGLLSPAAATQLKKAGFKTLSSQSRNIAGIFSPDLYHSYLSRTGDYHKKRLSGWA